MLGFKNFDNASTTIAVIELMRRLIKSNSRLDAYASKIKPRLRSGAQ
jgi:transposase-like protein